jgi:hypothetical protein
VCKPNSIACVFELVHVLRICVGVRGPGERKRCGVVFLFKDPHPMSMYQLPFAVLQSSGNHSTKYIYIYIYIYKYLVGTCENRTVMRLASWMLASTHTGLSSTLCSLCLVTFICTLEKTACPTLQW